MLTHRAVSALIYSTSLCVCLTVCMHAPSARVDVCQPQWEPCVRSQWRLQRHWRRHALRLDSAIPGIPWSVQLCLIVSIYDKKMGAYTDLWGNTGGAVGRGFLVVPSCWRRALRGVVSPVWKGQAPGLTLRSGDIRHIVCEKHCSMPSFFSVCPFSGESE